MGIVNLSNILELKSGGIFKKDICDVFVSFGDKIHPPKNFLVICDAGTKHIALGISSKIYEISTLASLEEELKNYEGIFAVGSGTVCDFAKFTSFKAKKPFICFGTALSMNGYLSSFASIRGDDGLKVSVKCHLPKALYFDLKILQEAPILLTKAGFGDAMARASAQNDCLLSSKRKGTPYNEDLFNFRLPSERFLLENYKQLNTREDEFMLELLENTLFAGLSMHLHGSSFTASGGEHAMAHFAELKFSHIKEFFHGLQIAGFTCEMLKIQSSFKDEQTFECNNLHEVYKELQIPNSYQDLNLTDAEFELIKKEATTVRDRFGFLNLL
jgi:glycerol dehydrogenase-like iron-containing ADH family enzyme